ncbi:MAG: hypothetical protein QMD85_03830 [Candidatus Aenigmarchaeota archaeon]|nr:hypothetical protein [Candidatus Aenigmarchaeota archaeon]MDI6722686.1 hypothetical protein [Candidatus Aenigmarchaeota archaeon]
MAVITFPEKFVGPEASIHKYLLKWGTTSSNDAVCYEDFLVDMEALCKDYGLPLVHDEDVHIPKNPDSGNSYVISHRIYRDSQATIDFNVANVNYGILNYMKNGAGRETSYSGWMVVDAPDGCAIEKAINELYMAKYDVTKIILAPHLFC